MEGIKVFEKTLWHPLKIFGQTSPLWGVHKETVIATWATILVILTLVIIARILLKKGSGAAHFIITSFVRYFIDLVTETMGFFNFAHFSFVTGLFIFIFACNTINVFIPWLEEPTSDLNTTLALGLSSFVYIQIASVKALGIREYLKEYFSPVFMFPMHVTSKLASIASISFRLFGNIFGGAIITQLYNNMKIGSLLIESVLLLTGLNLVITLFFGIFEGLIQAFIFCMLTVTYLAIAVHKEEEEH